MSVSLPTRRYAAAAEVFAEALERLSADDETGPVAEAIADAAKDHGRALGREARHKAGKRPGRAALRKALVGVLETSGFEPEIAGTGSVTLCNCPYRMLSDRHRDVTCGMNLAWAEGVAEGLGSSALAPSAMPTPGRCCVTFASPTE